MRYLAGVATFLSGMLVGVVLWSLFDTQPVVEVTRDNSPSNVEPANPTSVLPDVMQPTSVDTPFGKYDAVFLETRDADFEQLKSRVLEISEPGIYGRHGTNEYEYLPVYIARMLEIDPEATIDFLKASTTRQHYQALCKWSQFDRDAAINYLLGTSDRVEGWHCLLNLDDIDLHPRFTELGERVGQDFWREWEKIQILALPNAEAFTRALELSDRHSRHVAIDIARRWAKEDVSALISALAQVKDRNLLNNIVPNALGDVMRENPHYVMNMISNHFSNSADLIGNLLGNLGRSLTFDEARDIADAYISLSSPHGSAAIARMLFRADPERAMAYFEQFDVTQQNIVYSQLSHTVARDNPERAFQWALKLGNDLSQAKQNIFRFVADSDPSIVMARFRVERDPVNRRLMLIALSYGLSERDPGAAVDWLMDYQDEPGFESGFRRAFYSWLRVDPWAAGDLLHEFGHLKQAQYMVDQTVRTMISLDRQRADAYVDSFADEGLKTYALATMIRHDGIIDLDGVLDSLDRIEDDKIRNNTRASIASHWASKDPENIDQLADTLELSADHIQKLKETYIGRE